jgi:DNA modification methylase
MIINGNSLEELKKFPDNYFHSVVTDPPYGLSFMGKKWDYDVPSIELWQEVFRVLKEGGYLLSFAGTRTQHRMAVNIEDAGFEIRDMIAWVYGSGFPKSHNIGKKLKEWEGWGTALKPALEPITMARKPFKTSVAENVLKNGVGGINIDGCRVGTGGGTKCNNRINGECQGHDNNHSLGGGIMRHGKDTNPQGRFPANFIHDGSDEVTGLFPYTKSGKTTDKYTKNSIFGVRKMSAQNGSEGSASRFFYCAKASKQDRNEGLEKTARKEGFEDKKAGSYEFRQDGSLDGKETKANKNNHPTVKPTDLMRYLVRLVTPKNGIVLDCFMGSGSTGKACALEGFEFVGIDLDKDYCEIAKARIEKALEDKKTDEAQTELF